MIRISYWTIESQIQYSVSGGISSLKHVYTMSCLLRFHFVEWRRKGLWRHTPISVAVRQQSSVSDWYSIGNGGKLVSMLRALGTRGRGGKSAGSHPKKYLLPDVGGWTQKTCTPPGRKRRAFGGAGCTGDSASSSVTKSFWWFRDTCIYNGGVTTASKERRPHRVRRWVGRCRLVSKTYVCPLNLSPPPTFYPPSCPSSWPSMLLLLQRP